jgi:glycosyltransferase involved in cell wall biosynthesis
MTNTRPYVGLNAHLLSATAGYRSAGIHGYIAELIKRLPSADAGLRYTAMTHPLAAKLIAGMPTRTSHLPTEQPWARIAWEQCAQPFVAARERFDLLHGLAFVSPLMGRCPTVVTVHDLSFALFPAWARGANAAYLRLFTHLSCKQATRIIAVSEHTRRDVIRLYGVADDKVQAIPHGVDARFGPRPRQEIADFRRAHALPERFILFVGTLEPRKNLVRLIHAYSNIKSQMSSVKLVLVGGRAWADGEIFTTIETLDLKEEVIWAGYAAAADLPLWYNSADVFAFPSLYEGFGMPLLEAMACGTPVVTSAAACLPEVAGDAALIVPPDDADALADALQRALTDHAVRQTLRANGLARAAAFAWEDTARRTAAVYRQALALEAR